MTRIKITNGFRNIPEKGILLTGKLIEGNVYLGDILVVDHEREVPIMNVEFDKIIVPEETGIILTVPDDNEIEWYKLYGKTFEIKNTAYNTV